jgi:hypothetical protein
MSVSNPIHRRLVLAAGFAATAIIAACSDSPTQPSAATRIARSPVAIEGDTTQCEFGWVVVAGRYECKLQ